MISKKKYQSTKLFIITIDSLKRNEWSKPKHNHLSVSSINSIYLISYSPSQESSRSIQHRTETIQIIHYPFHLWTRIQSNHDPSNFS